MTSLFESATPYRTELPVDLLTCDQRGVSLLEFFPLSQPQEQAVKPQPGAGDAPGLQADADFVAEERRAQMAVMIDAAREQAAAETRLEYASQIEALTEAEQARTSAIARAFAEDRQKYFHHAEAQVVQLALAVARRILSREIKADPMALQATIHAALARVQDESRSTLRVATDQIDEWQTLFAQEQTVQVVSDSRLQPGECVLETTIGKVELGLEAQLLEVQRTFDGLLSTQGEL